MSPTSVNVLAAVQITEASEYCTLSPGVAPAIEVTVPELAKLTAPAPIRWTLIIFPTDKVPVGIVTVNEEPLFIVTNLSTSEACSV
jgi:hypothetical protein